MIIQTVAPRTIDAMRKIVKNYQSFNNGYDYGENLWVISIVNESENGGLYHQLFGGHAAIIIEGVKEDGTLHIGHYDIEAGEIYQDGWFNPTGVITKIRCIEDNMYSTTNCFESYQKLSSRAFYVLPSEADRLIKSIKADQRKVEEYRRYKHLCDIGRQTPGEVPRPEPLYFQLYRTVPWLGDPNKGDNCVSWCWGKLREVVPNIGKDPKKPWFAANKKLDWIYQNRYRLIGGLAAGAISIYLLKSESENAKLVRTMLSF